MSRDKDKDESPDKKKKSNKDFFDMDSIMDSITPMIGMMIMMPMILSKSSIAQDTSAIAQQMELQAYQGINDPRWIEVNNTLQYFDFINDKPYQPWMIAYIVNYGPYPVNVSINYPGEFFTIEAGGTRTINRSGARERLNVLFFQCEDSDTARVSVTGEY